ncbi:MAG: class II aldolase/adducin family protein [Candidatus Pacebacteria bacterium]|jgi:rhamnose utilization protein RhaD (predicted bifunctional aldolase and dehydrogenase)|nr:class II aldolase/adducin family protein [Candidatus Paceibacterota bacterium]
MAHELKSLIEISKKIGKRPDYVQGGGGNTSVKIGKNKMIIKASGFRLSELRVKKGLVSVDHQKIVQFYSTVKGRENITDVIIENDRVVKDSIHKKRSGEELRPSIETGFHSLAGKFVIHSHSVYANIFNCSKEGKKILSKMFKEAIFVPYYPPGISLTIGVRKALGKRESKIFFLENHGIVVCGETAEDAYVLHEEITNCIKKDLKIRSQYPKIKVVSAENGCFKSESDQVSDLIRKHKKTVKKFRKIVLFPDQLVYGDDVGFLANAGFSIRIDVDKGAVFYNNMSYAKAFTFEEVFVAWLFIIDQIRRFGLTLKTISKKEIDFILNMESEKYRKKLCK